MRTAPDYIQFYPTLRCNQSCDFCFNRSLPEMGDMDLPVYLAMLDVLAPLSMNTIDMMGGEPTLHPDVLGLITEANERGFHVNLSSNGTNINLLEEIMNRSDDVTVGLSINDRETLDRHRKFIRRKHPIIKTVFSRSLDQALIADIMLLYPKVFYLIYRDATSRQDVDETIPFPLFMRKVTTRMTASQIGMVYCSGFLPDADCPELKSVRCPAGTTKLGIMPDGSAYPCNLFFGKRDFLLGNILAEPFEAIWNHQKLDFFRFYSGNKCPQRSCGYHAQCHGGCPAQSLTLSGSLDAPDPRCAGR